MNPTVSQQFPAGPPQGKLTPSGGSDHTKWESVGVTCQNCDNCLTPPDVWDGTDAARKLLSTIYRIQQHSNISFGAGHIMDILRGKTTEKVTQFGHAQLSTFGIGSDLSELQMRGVLRQLIALNAVAVDAQAFNTLKLTDGSRAVLKGDVPVRLRESTSFAGDSGKTSGLLRKGKKAPAEKGAKTTKAALPKAAIALDEAGQARFAALKAWRVEVAKEHNLPAYVIFHDATLAAIAQQDPQTLDDLNGINGIGARKLEAYGEAVLRATAAMAHAH